MTLASLGIRAASLAIGRRFGSSLAEMQAAQWMRADELRARSERKLSALLYHAARHVPFYRERYCAIGAGPGDLRSVEDLRALPPMKKPDYRSRPARDFLAENVPGHLRFARATSGSTGQPFRFFIDRRTVPVIFASHLFYDSWFGLQPFSRYVRIVSPPAAAAPPGPQAPSPARGRAWVTRALQEAYERRTQEKILVWEVTAASAGEILRRIERFRPDFIMGYASTLAIVADELHRLGRKYPLEAAAVVTIAETLTPAREAAIRRFFGAPIVNRYGLREFGSWSAQSCSVSPVRFHVNTEIAVCEILRDDGTPARPGEAGRVVLTDLCNYAMPFIRYETGDLAVAAGGNCDCGRGFPLIGPVEGRSTECLRTASGKVVSPAFLGHYLFVFNQHADAVRDYQLVQESERLASLLVVPSKSWDESARARLAGDMSLLLGPEMSVTVRTVEEIPPEKSGKRPIIKRIAS